MNILNTKYRKTIASYILGFYLVVTIGFVFHYHHINLSADSLLAQTTSDQNAVTSDFDRNGFLCIIHSNIQSIHTAFQIQSFGNVPAIAFPVRKYIENYNSPLEKLLHSSANPLRAPPKVS